MVLLGVSQGIKCILTMILVLWQPQWGIVNFSIAQVSSACVKLGLVLGCGLGLVLGCGLALVLGCGWEQCSKLH